MYASISPFWSRRWLVVLTVALVLITGFVITSMASYQVSRSQIRESILSTELPLTSDNIYSEIQKDLVRPILIASMMARDTFVRDWAMGGEQDVTRMTRYLKEVMAHYGAFTSFFVSERSRKYYHPDGILKSVKEGEQRDAWYFRTRKMQDPYEINVDPDLAHQDRLTIFINYKVFDYEQRFIGATGVGLAADSVARLIAEYQRRYQREIYFVDATGHVVMSGHTANSITPGTLLQNEEGLKTVVAAALSGKQGSFEYRRGGKQHLLNVRYIPDLKWYLFVAKESDAAFAGIRSTLYSNLAVCLVVSLLVLSVFILTIGRYQVQLETMAATDPLTGLHNRRTFSVHLDQAIREARRNHQPLSLLMVDLDHFKRLNDTLGHGAGDDELRRTSECLRTNLREADLLCRWGGEEFAIMLKATSLQSAASVAEKLRAAIGANRSNNLTASFGVAELATGDGANTVLSRTDAALYLAKQQGRNCVKTQADLELEGLGHA